jgi:acetyl esterase/lipase
MAPPCLHIRQKVTTSLLFAWLLVALGECQARPLTLQDYMQMQKSPADERIAYGQAPDQFIEYFRPTKQATSRRPFPVAVIIHGGCWLHKFEGLRQVSGMARALAKEGYAVYSVEYRGIDQAGGGYPGTYKDITSALDSIRDRQKQDHLDLGRIIGIGHSAGAQLVLWAAGRGNIPNTSPLFEANPVKLHAVIGLGALPDLADRPAIHNACGIPAEALYGGNQRPDALRDTSPAAMLPLDVHRIVLINGLLDTVSLPETVKAFAAEAQQRGNAVHVIDIPASSHYDEVSTSSPVWRPLLREVQDSASK